MPNIGVLDCFLLSGVRSDLEDVGRAHDASDEIVLTKDKSHSSPSWCWVSLYALPSWFWRVYSGCDPNSNGHVFQIGRGNLFGGQLFV